MDIRGTGLHFASKSLFIASGCLRIYILAVDDSIPEYPDVIAERGSVVLFFSFFIPVFWRRVQYLNFWIMDSNKVFCTIVQR